MLIALDSSREQLGTQVATGIEHDRQKALFQLAAGHPPGAGTDIERRQHLTRRIIDRYGNRAQPLLQFLIDNTPALLTNQLQAFKQRFGGANGPAGLGLQIDVIQYSCNDTSSSAANRIRPIDVQ